MQILTIISLAATAVVAQAQAGAETGQLGDATRNFDNPRGAAYRAVLEPNALNVTGMITAVTSRDGATEFAVEFGNLPAEGGPFIYHLHVDPVPSNGDCQGTLAHLDPFIRGEATPCVAERPETCQVGDLAGKYGPMTDTIYNASFTDPFVSLREDMGAFFGNRSFVLHYANTSRIACGNFSTLSESRRPGAGVGTNPNVLLNSSMSTTTTSVLDNLFATVAPTNGSGPLNNLLTTTSTSLFFANATAFVTPSAVGTGGPLQVTASSATSVRTSLGLVLVSSLIGLVAFS